LRKVRCQTPLNDIEILYSESQSRLLVTVSEENVAEFEKLFSGQEVSLLGTVTEKQSLEIIGMDGSVIIDRENSVLKEAWQAPLREM